MNRDSARHTIRLQNATRVGKLTLNSTETQNVQLMQVAMSAWETYDNLHSIQLYGLASAALSGCDAVILTLAGDSADGMVIATNDNRFRPQNMLPGEVMLYDNKGQQIYVSQPGGVLTISIQGGQQVNVTASTAITVTAPTVTVNGNLVVTGTITANGDVQGNNISLDKHVHPGVTGGTGSTGLPVG